MLDRSALLSFCGTHGIRTRDLPIDNRLRYQLRQRPMGIWTAVGICARVVRLHGFHPSFGARCQNRTDV